ncbi:hypothetical protein JO972_10165 [Verrucomicrobiaceae bacterium 5K15]|uniref:Uncharacterized protein n=1 Tax=Oceaniferula flava TaxID=2800421 RepID=A0AAE2SCH2_9BACT|nr:hypothetical protein [Oceaniferula flavus]MBK1855323.1 hypothetical protein [Oceaniferula flavus]MBM1136629.1 hypothetical protein [Oceaniferula flavus]
MKIHHLLVLLLAASSAVQAGNGLPVRKGLMLDLDADHGVELEEGNRVKAWHNQVKGNAADVFVKRDEGRKVPGSGRPTFVPKVKKIGGHNTLAFDRQELINMDEDVFDHLLTGSGYTWVSVMSIGQQKQGKKDVNSFFGNLKNGSNYEGFWGCLDDANHVWMGSRCWPAEKKGRQPLWNEKNPKVTAPEPLALHRYYLVMGRMGAGKGTVNLDLYINSATPADSQKVPVNPKANSSKMAIGQERDATNHPGHESFVGEITRFLIFDRPLSDQELADLSQYLMKRYDIGTKK